MISIILPSCHLCKYKQRNHRHAEQKYSDVLHTKSHRADITASVSYTHLSFCEQVEVDGVRRDKYVRQTRREIDEGTVREVYEDGFPEPKSKPLTYVDDEYAERAVRCSRTYYEYAKDICENYRMDLRRYKLIRERKQYIGISNRETYQAIDVYKRQASACPPSGKPVTENPHMENPVVVKAHLSAALAAVPRSRPAALSVRQRRPHSSARCC